METKPGYKTTEWWAFVITQVAIIASALAGSLQPRYAAIAGAVATAAYAIARGLAKAGVKPIEPPPARR